MKTNDELLCKYFDSKDWTNRSIFSFAAKEMEKIFPVILISSWIETYETMPELSNIEIFCFLDLIPYCSFKVFEQL